MTFCSTAMTAGSAIVVPMRAPARPNALERVRRMTRFRVRRDFRGKTRDVREIDVGHRPRTTARPARVRMTFITASRSSRPPVGLLGEQRKTSFTAGDTAARTASASSAKSFSRTSGTLTTFAPWMPAATTYMP